MHFRAREAQATDSDIGLTFEWANDPLVRANGFHPEVITREGHQRWLRAVIQDPRRTLVIVEASPDRSAWQPVGQVRLDGEQVGLLLSPDSRGRGLASEVLRTGLRVAVREVRPTRLTAYILEANQPSRRAFERLGFRETESLTMGGRPVVKYEADPTSLGSG